MSCIISTVPKIILATYPEIPLRWWPFGKMLHMLVLMELVYQSSNHTGEEIVSLKWCPEELIQQNSFRRLLEAHCSRDFQNRSLILQEWRRRPDSQIHHLQIVLEIIFNIPSSNHTHSPMISMISGVIMDEPIPVTEHTHSSGRIRVLLVQILHLPTLRNLPVIRSIQVIQVAVPSMQRWRPIMLHVTTDPLWSMGSILTILQHFQMHRWTSEVSVLS